MSYVDAFVLPLPKKNLAAYRKMARLGCKIWMEHGALEYRECVKDDPATEGGSTFAKALGLKKGETVVFAWIRYKSRRHRDAVNAKVFKDPRLHIPGGKMPFDMKRMVHGCFLGLVEA